MRRHCNWMGRELGGISHLEQHFGRKGRRNRGFWGLGHRTSSTLMSVLFFYTRCFGRPPHASRVPWLGRSRPRCARRLDCHAHLTSAAIASALPSLPRRPTNVRRRRSVLPPPAPPCGPARPSPPCAPTAPSLPPSLLPCVRRASRTPHPVAGAHIIRRALAPPLRADWAAGASGPSLCHHPASRAGSRPALPRPPCAANVCKCPHPPPGAAFAPDTAPSPTPDPAPVILGTGRPSHPSQASAAYRESLLKVPETQVTTLPNGLRVATEQVRPPARVHMRRRPTRAWAVGARDGDGRAVHRRREPVRDGEEQRHGALPGAHAVQGFGEADAGRDGG